MIKSLCRTSAQLALPTGADKHGVQQFGTAGPVKIRWEPKSTLFTNAQGNTEQADGEAFILPSSLVPDVGAKLTISGQDYKLVTCSPEPGLSGRIEFYDVIAQKLKGAG